MTININELKNAPVLEEEQAFFQKYKRSFIKTFTYYYEQHFTCAHCILDVDTIANNLFDALYDTQVDCYEKQLCPLFKMKENHSDLGFFFAKILHDIVEEFLDQSTNDEKNIKQLKKILNFLKEQISLLHSLLETNKEERHFEVTSTLAVQNSNIAYLQNLSNLSRNIKFFVHTQIGTSMSYARIEQVGNNSITIQVSDEQLSALKLVNNSFIIKNDLKEKNFSVRARIICPETYTVALENIVELQTLPLLSRKYPRAAIMHASLVHLANENECITGNMIDISKGGIGVISSDKGSFQKGQEIVAFLSYEDPKNEYSFSFEATGYIASVIGKENAFRYGLSLNLSKEEKELISNLVASL